MVDLKQNGLLPATTLTVEDAAVEWLRWLADYRGRSRLTVKNYGSTARLLVEWLGGPRLLSAVTHDDVERFVTRTRRGGHPAAPATANRDLATLRSFFGWCVDKQYLGVSPAALVHGPTMRRRQPRPIDDTVWRLWWDYRLPEGLRLALGLGFYGGLRRAEITGLDASQVVDGKIVNFVRKGGGEHSLPLSDMVDIVCAKMPHVAGDVDGFWAAVRMAKRRGGNVTGWRIADPMEMNRRIQRFGERNGLPLFTPHQLRHSAATNMVRSGVPIHLVSSLLNHSDISITMGYVAAGGEQLAEWKRSIDLADGSN
jgi:integrase